VRSILITGAAAGIGRATAQLFAKRGWFVGLYDIASTAETEKTIDAAQRLSGALDVRDAAAWREAIAAFGRATGGRLDVLFNNAGVARFGRFDTVPPEETERVLDVNLKGVVNGVYAALPLLAATPGARIINTASAASMHALPRAAAYSATKFAVRGLSQALDIELRELGVRCIAIAPWFIETPLLDTVAHSGDHSIRKAIRGLKVYPVELAAEGVWRAAHGKPGFVPVGQDARELDVAARLFPGLVRRRMARLARKR
jgi:NAD(P)-dependent dehydrogenase (short-subunit alcohol dehydrogenase family)